MSPADIRLVLLAKGYDPIPLSGKRPPMQAWSQVIPDEQLIRLWSRHDGYPGATNTGVLARRTPCLDLDVLNPECADAMEAHVREKFEERGYVISRIGRWPKRAIPFRTDEPFSKITLALGRGEEKIEFLANGQQFAAFGTHPDTHKDYQWPRGSILEIAHEDLPYITQAEAEALKEELREIARQHGYEPKPKTDGGGDGTYERADIEELTRQVLSGESLHNSVLKIAGSYAGRGSPVQDCIDYIGLAFTAAHQPRYGGRWDECCAAIDYCYGKERAKNAEKDAENARNADFAFADLNLDGQLVPEQEWSVPGRIPARQACLFSGYGAAGKSTIALHLCCAHALGREWLGCFPTLGPAIFIDAEDDFGVIWRRLDAIRAFYGVSYTDLIMGGLHILPMAGKDTVLAIANKDGKIVKTAFYDWLLREATAMKAEQVVIASAANVFAGNENDRSQVQQFQSLLVGIAQATGGSVTLISHPSRMGMSDNGGLYSGSTQWHNAFRARIGIESDKDTPDLRKITFLKNQYGPEDESLTVRWKDGMFLPEPKPGSYEQAARDAKVEALIVTLTAKCNRAHQLLSPMLMSRTYLPTVLAKADEAKGITKKELAAAMDRLIANGTLVVKTWGPPSAKRPYIEVRGAPADYPADPPAD